MAITFQNRVLGNAWVYKVILIMLIFRIVPSASVKRKVVNYVPGRDAHHKTTSVKPYQFPTYGNMEDIIKSPPFRNRVSDVAEDPNVWSEALSAYDQMMSNLPKGSDPKVDPSGYLKRGIFVPWASAAEYTDPSLRDKNVIGDKMATHYGLDGPSPFAGRSHEMDWSGPENEIGSHHEHVRQAGGHHHEDGLKPKNQVGKESGGVGRQLKMRDEGEKATTVKPDPIGTNPPSQTCSGQSSDNQADGKQDITLNERLLENSIMTPELMYEGCGGDFPKGKACYGVPTGCIKKQVCRLAVTFSWSEETSSLAYSDSRSDSDSDSHPITVNLAGESSGSGFVALAFSGDRFLGDDIVFYCIDTETAPSKRRIALFSSITDGIHSKMQRNRHYFQSNFCPKFGYPGEGIIACSFKLSTRVFRDDGESMNIFNLPYFLMLAFGHYIDDLPKDDPDYGSLKYQSLIEWSEHAITLRDVLLNPKIIQSRSSALITLHVILGVASIVFLIPSASFVAKYGREILGYPVITFGSFQMPKWLSTHIYLTLLSIPLMLISTLSILIELNFEWKSHRLWPFLHSASGAICIILLVVSMFLGYMLKGKQEKAGNNKSQEDDPRLRLMSWAHWLIGNLTYCFGIFCVCIAASLARAQAPCYVEYFAYLHVALHVLTHLVMMIDTRKLVRSLDNKHMCQRAILGPMIPFSKKFSSYEDSVGLAQWQKRRLAISFYFIVSFLCAFTICVLMLLPVVLCR